MSDSSSGESPPRQPSSIRKVIVASLIGTSLEWYDFFIYGTAAALVFNKLFFPSFEPLVGTLLAFTTYAVGFVARPLGGVMFGHYGDKLGRKNVLVVTLLLMGISTFLIGVLPTHATIGVWAPVLLVFLRFLQGLGLGGEWGGAVLMTLESGDPLAARAQRQLATGGGPDRPAACQRRAIADGHDHFRRCLLVVGLARAVSAQWIAGRRRPVDPDDDRREPSVQRGRGNRQQGRGPDHRSAAPLSQEGAAGNRCANRGRRRLLHLCALRDDLCRHLPRTPAFVRAQRSVDRSS